MINIKKIFSPKVLTGLAVLGVFGTALFAIKESKEVVWEEYDEESFEVDEEEEEEAPATDIKAKVVKAGKIAYQYKGTIACATLTVLCVIGAQRLNTKELAALTATCGYLAANRDTAEQFLSDHSDGGEEWANYDYNEKTDIDRDEISRAKDSGKLLPIEDTGNGDILFRETYTGRWYKSNLDAVEQGIVRLNDRFDQGETLAFNEFYKEQGLAKTMFGSTVGWNTKYSDTRRIEIWLEKVKTGGIYKQEYYRVIIAPEDYPYAEYLS